MDRADWGFATAIIAVVILLIIGIAHGCERKGYCTACCSGKGLQPLTTKDRACTCFPANGGPVVAFRDAHCEAK